MIEEVNHNGLDLSSGGVLREDVKSPIINNNNNNNNYKNDSLSSIGVQVSPGQSKYGQLLSVIEEMSRDLRPTYAGSKSSNERLKKGIVHARILVRECLLETERSAQHQQ